MPKAFVDANGVEMVPVFLRGGPVPRRGVHPRAPGH